jgi:AcrR family transcriptional regulator
LTPLSGLSEHGFEGTSTDMLVRAMKIGRQSLYDTFGDKWKLYCLAVERYSIAETRAHIATLRGEPRAVDGIRAMIGRVVEDAQQACLGVGSICEFGESRQELSALRQPPGSNSRPPPRSVSVRRRPTATSLATPRQGRS